jgi:hypothetical protein
MPYQGGAYYGHIDCYRQALLRKSCNKKVKNLAYRTKTNQWLKKATKLWLIAVQKRC